jgi:tetratricopeptide (TPR) repeat protein
LPAAVPGHPEPPKLHDLLLEKVPLFFLSGLFAAITYDAQYRMGAMAQRRASEESVQMSLVGYGWYLEKTVWPMGLGLFYPLDAVQPMLTDTPWLPVAVGVLLLLLTTLFGWLARGYPSLLIGWLWFVGTLLPVSGLIRFSPFAYADRFSYLPHSGLFLGTMIGIWSILRSRGGPKLADSLVGLAGLVILAGMGWLTYQRVQMWDSTETLLRRSLDRNANDNNALLSLAAWLQQEDRWPEARAIYLQSYALYPDRPERNLDLGRAMLRANELTEARKYFERLLELLPSDANYSMWAHVHLSMIELREGRRKEAEEHLRYAQGLNPLSPHPYHHAGELYDRYDEIAQAQKQYQTALTLAAQQRIPYLASYERLVRLLARHGQLNEAARIAQEWIDLGLRDSEPYFYQARLLTQNGELEQALSRTQSAIEFRRRELQYACFAGYLQHRLGQRDAKQTYQSVAAQHKGRQALREHIWELVTHAHSHFRDGKLALQLLEDHFEPEPAVPEELDAWAAAHAEVGDFDQAVRHAEKALALDAPAVVKQVRKDRLELYKHQKPCRFPDKPNQVR